MPFILFDTEYIADRGFLEEGFNGWQNREIIQIGALKISDDLQILDTFNYYIKPKKTSLTYPITKASSVNKYIQINGSVYYRTTTDVGIESKKLWGLHAQTKIKLLALDKKNKRAKVDERSFIGRSEQ